MNKLFGKIKNNKIIRNVCYFVPLLFKLNPLAIISTIFSAMIITIIDLCWIYFPKEIIDLLMDKDNPNQVSEIVTIVILFVGITFVTSVLLKLNGNIQSHYAKIADFKIDDMFNKKIVEIDYYHLEDPKFIDKLELAKKGLRQHSNGIYSILNTIENIISGISTLIGVIAIVLLSNQLLVIIITIIGIIVNSYAYSKYADYNQEYNNNYVRYGRKQWYFNNSIFAFRSQKNLRLYNTNKFLNEKAKNINGKVINARKKTNEKVLSIQLIDICVSKILVTLFTFILLGYAVYKENMSIAIFTMLYSSIQTFSSCVSNLSYTIKSHSKTCEYQNEFIDIMKMKTVNREGKRKIEKIESIEFKNVSFKYPRTDTYILKDVSFKIDNKEKISLVGLNGAGKTTLIKLICRFFELEEGMILINGIDIKEYNYKEYMKLISVVFQDFKIISYTVKDNIAIIDENKEKLDDCLKRAQAFERVNELPNKEDTYINKWFDKSGVEFSGGELQKFAIARALYKDSDFVIMDEPTSALDPVSESEIYYHFKEVVGKKLTLYISHRLSSCIFSDRILVLDGANIVEEGTHKELMTNENGLYYKMFKSQAKYYES